MEALLWMCADGVSMRSAERAPSSNCSAFVPALPLELLDLISSFLEPRDLLMFSEVIYLPS